MNVVLHVWRQENADAAGKMVVYQADDINPDMSFLEMPDVVNERLTERGDVPVAFEHDCREGICGSCGLMINGVAHGPMTGTATCQLQKRRVSAPAHGSVSARRRVRRKSASTRSHA